MRKLLFIVLLFASAFGFATHNRAGEILYQRIAPLTQMVGGVEVPLYKYLITVVLYTDDGTSASPNNLIADRCTDTIYFGDGQSAIIERSNGGTPLCAGCVPCGCNHCGQIIVDDPDGYRVKVNTYTVTHVYAGAGQYTISTLDPNRNGGVYNMSNSDLQPFYIESLLTINNFSGANSSPIFSNPPTDRACFHKCFYHDPGAYDIDGDSLSFEMTTSRGSGGQTVQGYFFPDPGQVGTIDPITGVLTWCTPQVVGQYNIAFIVKEWRKNTSGKREVIGYVLRDMQVIVGNCPINNPPDILTPADTCVEAGTLLQKNIYISDVITPPDDPSDNYVTLTGSAGAFAGPQPNATLNNTYGVTPYTAQFTWQTNCSHVRNQPYMSVFKAKDEGPNQSLVNFKTYSVKVVPPSIKNVTVTPSGSSLILGWSLPTCSPPNNPLTAYRIYRKNDCSAYTYSPCSVGVDPASGFTLISTVTNTAAITFTDSNNGSGLSVGQNYSYMIVAVYDDGSLSYGSTLVCGQLRRDVPLLLNADVRNTSNTNGSVYVRWLRPLVDPLSLDTLAHPGPYQYILYYRPGAAGSYTPVFTTSSNYFLALATDYLHNGINTSDSLASYMVGFTASTGSIGASSSGTSIFLTATPADRKITLHWRSFVPWHNYNYTVYRRGPTSASFTAVGTTTQTFYEDTSNVVNRYNYCYKILGDGKYSDPTIVSPLLNYSQEVCATAKDLTPPCSPTITIEADCPKGFVKVNWNNVRNICSDDVLKYALFYKPTVDEPYALVDTLDNNTFSRTYDGLTLISGCYAIQAVDSSGNASPMSVDFCLDNCPEFELPNIFSPNSDKVNDNYKAIKVRQIQEIDLSIFDRWGNLVYKTHDPYFQWDGTSLQSKLAVSDGTFFYFCTVYEKRLTGLRQRQLKGYLQVVR